MRFPDIWKSMIPNDLPKRPAQTQNLQINLTAHHKTFKKQR